MAGIGFHLRNIIDCDHGLFHSIKSYGFAVATINGPMILCITAAGIAQFILGGKSYSGIPSDRILTTIMHAFVMSAFMIGGYSLVLTRYVSDCIHDRKFEKIMPSVYGAIIPAAALCILISASIVFFAGMELQYGISISVLYSDISIIGLLTIYISAVKDYRSITAGFLTGNAFTVLALLFLIFIPQRWSLLYIIIAFDAGFSLTAALLAYKLRKTFGEGTGSSMEWIRYFKKYPSLALTGLFYTAGLYFSCVYYRFSDSGSFINGFMAVKPEFDLPFYFAVLGMIPGLVYFTVRFETALYADCNTFFSTMASDGTYDEIDFSARNLVGTIKYSYIKLALVQSCVTLLMLVISFMSAHAVNFGKCAVFWAYTIGMSSTLLMYVSKIVVLYFDARSHALMIASAYFLLNISFTVITDKFSLAPPGIGFMSASILSVIMATVIMIKFTKNIGSYAFMMRKQ